MTRRVHEVKKIGSIARRVFLRKVPHPLKKWMRSHRVTSVKLSAMSGIADSTIRGMVRYKDPSKRTCLVLSRVTGIPPEALMFAERFKDYQSV